MARPIGRSPSIIAVIRTSGLLLAIAIASAATDGQQQEQQTFRLKTDAVFVHVSVRQSSRTVSDLRCEEFELRDSGVIQVLEACDYDSMPLHIVVAADTSQSVLGPALNRIEAAVAQIRKLQRPEDRFELLTFASGIRRSDTPTLTIEEGLDRGHTALLDAIATGLMLPSDPGRRRVIFVLTDGLDTYSIIPKELVQGMVDRTDTPIHIHAIAEVRGDWMSVAYRNAERDYFWFLRELTNRSGGSFSDETPKVELGQRFESAISELRTRYILRYVPSGVPPAGWHPVEVKIKRPGRYSVLARRGYHRD